MIKQENSRKRSADGMDDGTPGAAAKRPAAGPKKKTFGELKTLLIDENALSGSAAESFVDRLKSTAAEHGVSAALTVLPMMQETTIALGILDAAAVHGPPVGQRVLPLPPPAGPAAAAAPPAPAPPVRVGPNDISITVARDIEDNEHEHELLLSSLKISLAGSKEPEDHEYEYGGRPEAIRRTSDPEVLQEMLSSPTFADRWV